MKNIILLVFIAFSIAVTGQKVDHSKFDALLQSYVSKDGKVDYKGLVSKKPDLKSIIDNYARVTPESLIKNEQLAFYINLYNAHTLYLIIDKYPVKSIKDLEGGKPWDTKRISLKGTLISLNHLENAIIRPQFKDPRIHFAVNCAAVSCPPLLNKAYQAAALDAQLDNQTKLFINDQNSNKGSKVSMIFNWYKEDFGNLVDYLNKYLTKKLPSNTKFSYQNYNWSLNGK
jgi:hypothetical protein